LPCAWCSAMGASANEPAILAHVSSDLASLAVCGYIGGRCMHLKYPGPAFGSPTWMAWGFAAALVTAFGGGSIYVLLMKGPGGRTFGWQDPRAVSAALLGFLLSLYLVPNCGSVFEEFLGASCGDAFTFLDCANNAVLIAWGCSKSSLDSALYRRWWRIPCGILATYAYSFGGGIVRDVVARCLLGPSAGAVGNLSPAVVVPAVVAMVFYQTLLVLQSSALLQLGLGLPVLVGIFYGGGIAFA